MAKTLDYDVLIIGSGMSGMALCVQADRKFGPNVRIGLVEKSGDLGGTWHLNTYPGAGCDIPSHFYSFDFAPNPEWSHFMSRRDEIWKYQQEVGRKFKIHDRTRFNTGCNGANWDAEDRSWIVHCEDQLTGNKYDIRTRILVPAVGGLHLPNDIGIQGSETFKGPIFHSARWEKDVDLKGKNVIVVGNGCSATQFVPIVCKEAKQVRQFVRSMHFLMPDPNFKYSSFARMLFRYVPFLMKIYRLLIASVLDASFAMFYVKGIGKHLRRIHQKQTLKYIRDRCPQKYHDIVVPDFQIGCKRRVMDTGYLDCLHRDNMDVTRDGLVQIKENSVVTKSGQEYPADVIILANGFKVGQFVVDIRGINGESLQEHWKKYQGPEAYFSTCLNGFPNMFLSMGPNSATGHFSYLFTSQRQSDFIIRLLEEVIPTNGKADKRKVIEVKEQAERKDVRWIEDETERTIVGKQGGCSAWYVQGGRNVALYPSFQAHFALRARFVRWQDFTIDGKSAGSALGSWTRRLLPIAGAVGLAAAIAN
ncbi:4-hydroxyacetophenone monooxygenase [Protomyces lactucae-debilis]|uniref:4-hydroxyacetophenone monooxygenase n=1 Tax=Protomyces lactucae-debilis TaxID=2754530 RepID=A0A1Y2F0E7_PROLT|nr:4-hydroxyacetophenone monooxygenase [Protomyces lactucae-debilis]ORY77358.1 4-hydroxyacetophenone monooxygenase [Protomyces lactucae-debilis]